MAKCDHDEHGTAIDLGVIGRKRGGEWERATSRGCPDYWLFAMKPRAW